MNEVKRCGHYRRDPMSDAYELPLRHYELGHDALAILALPPTARWS